MVRAVLWVPVAPLQAGRSTGFSLKFRQGLDISSLFFFSLLLPLEGRMLSCCLRASCALCKPDARHWQLSGVAALAGSCHELCLRGHFGKAEALLQSSAHPTAAPHPWPRHRGSTGPTFLQHLPKLPQVGPT